MTTEEYARSFHRSVSDKELADNAAQLRTMNFGMRPVKGVRPTCSMPMLDKDVLDKPVRQASPKPKPEQSAPKKFDKKAYQKEYMSKLRARNRAKRGLGLVE